MSQIWKFGTCYKVQLKSVYWGCKSFWNNLWHLSINGMKLLNLLIVLICEVIFVVLIRCDRTCFVLSPDSLSTVLFYVFLPTSSLDTIVLHQSLLTLVWCSLTLWIFMISFPCVTVRSEGSRYSLPRTYKID